ncbi:hypothetical protein MKZ38_003754 [Zalerion maritima]|uniref:UDP-galactose transporter homolog 1 n=1 Tax=Zalerion maritima TaxID=339359 RepID=A0AAD5WRJ3_9PEZI|nr:hypothetical protein MKZ38_003754 [Zalerion maritima]
MARTKQPAVRREPSSEYASRHNGNWSSSKHVNGMLSEKPIAAPTRDGQETGIAQLVVAVTGIYGSFLTWAYLQEKLTTTPYGDPSSPDVFKFPVFLNTVQSTFAATTGALYLYLSTPKGNPVPPIIPSSGMLFPLFLVAVTSALSSPFGYASLAHIDYITFLLAKSCKLLPVMLLHITIFRKRYPLYKYLVVAAVTAGVAVFTLHSGKKSHKSPSTVVQERNYPWGLLLLTINLLFDGLTNSTQDYIFGTFKPYSGPQMMCANNMMATACTAIYLLTSPWLVHTGIGDWVGMGLTGSSGELRAALEFLAKYPTVWRDVLGFAACGAVGQVFIFYTLSAFSSVVLVTITVTRKMATMILSVFAFGHHLSQMQWFGVALVFGGIGVEGMIQRREKLAKQVAAGASEKGEKKDL